MTVRDTLGMFDAAAAFPEQVEQALAEAQRDAVALPAHADIANVLVLGMGGSGIAGDVLAAVAGPFMSVPIVVCKNYEPPSFVDESTLVLALSFSGDTEETVKALQTAAVAGGKVVVVCRDGRLAELAEGWKAHVLRLPDGIPMPRAGLGALIVPPLVALEQIGLFPGAGDWIARAVDQLRRRRDELVADANPAAELARRIVRTLPIVYGGGEICAVAAARWKAQCNENAKVAAFANTHPELCHNEICGWGQHGDLTRQVFTLVNLRHDHEHPQVMRRFDLVSGMVDEVLAGVHEVRAEGDGALAQLLDLTLFGDFTTLHLAAQEGLDPGPVPALVEVKATLAQG
ncbi:bifunctional phosphoglucose/phosphomannose isomerase [soil metagenome]